jgi:hypothetical protein
MTPEAVVDLAERRPRLARIHKKRQGVQYTGMFLDRVDARWLHERVTLFERVLSCRGG